MTHKAFGLSFSDIRIMVLYNPSLFEILSRYLTYTETCTRVCEKLICQHRDELIQMLINYCYAGEPQVPDDSRSFSKNPLEEENQEAARKEEESRWERELLPEAETREQSFLHRPSCYSLTL